MRTRTLQPQYFIYAILALLFIFCYYHTFLWLHYKYSYQDSYYSHGYLIPFVSAFLIYKKRHVLKRTEISSSSFGLVIIIPALILHIFATMGDVNFLSGFSIFLYVLGSSLYLFGKEITKQIAFPLGFLILMFPIPGSFIDIVGLPLKSLATTIGLKISDLMSIPYLREGFKINLADTSLVVGTPCNGMKSLISFITLGLLLLQFAHIKMWIRIVMLSAIFPLAIFLNGCRIAILVFIANRYGVEKASPESYFHSLSGLLVFLVGLVFLFGFVKLSESRKRVS